MTAAEMKTLKYVLYICYLVLFKKELIQAFINSDNEVNVITPAYVKKLSFWVRKTDIGAQKINGITLVTYGIVVANFFLQNKYSRD